jgi:L-seryl-tRNA(Ser) seleniumtransferase
LAAGYSTLEYDAALGERGSRQSHVASLLKELTGAEDALVVNNNAAAVTLVLRSICEGREVIVSRGELVEVGGAFRIPEVMEQSGCLLREVGATNRTRPSDYRRHISPGRTGALLKAHTSNYRIVGFTGEVSLPELVGLGKETGLPVIYDLGSGSLLRLEPYGILGEPCVSDCVAQGVDILTFSGDKLLGGPQAGIILGKEKLIAEMKRHPLARAVRIDKLTLAALEATLRLYRDPERALGEIPTLRMLTETREALREKALRLILLCKDLGGQLSAVDTESQVGGGSAPGRTLPSAGVAVSPRALTAGRLEERLRGLDIPIVGRISHDAFIMDLRTAEEKDFPLIAESLREILGGEKE